MGHLSTSNQSVGVQNSGTEQTNVTSKPLFVISTWMYYIKQGASEALAGAFLNFNSKATSTKLGQQPTSFNSHDNKMKSLKL